MFLPPSEVSGSLRLLVEDESIGLPAACGFHDASRLTNVL